MWAKTPARPPSRLTWEQIRDLVEAEAQDQKRASMPAHPLADFARRPPQKDDAFEGARPKQRARRQR